MDMPRDAAPSDGSNFSSNACELANAAAFGIYSRTSLPYLTYEHSYNFAYDTDSSMQHNHIGSDHRGRKAAVNQEVIPPLPPYPLFYSSLNHASITNNELGSYETVEELEKERKIEKLIKMGQNVKPDLLHRVANRQQAKNYSPSYGNNGNATTRQNLHQHKPRSRTMDSPGSTRAIAQDGPTTAPPPVLSFLNLPSPLYSYVHLTPIQVSFSPRAPSNLHIMFTPYKLMNRSAPIRSGTSFCCEFPTNQSAIFEVLRRDMERVYVVAIVYKVLSHTSDTDSLRSYLSKAPQTPSLLRFLTPFAMAAVSLGGGKSGMNRRVRAVVPVYKYTGEEGIADILEGRGEVYKGGKVRVNRFFVFCFLFFVFCFVFCFLFDD